jgi:hypothetical protein
MSGSMDLESLRDKKRRRKMLSVFRRRGCLMFVIKMFRN